MLGAPHFTPQLFLRGQQDWPEARSGLQRQDRRFDAYIRRLDYDRRQRQFQTTSTVASWHASPSILSGDCTVAASGAITCTKTNNVTYGAGATESNAAKADMQTPVSSALMVTPAQLQNHPGVAKFFARLDGKDRNHLYDQGQLQRR